MTIENLCNVIYSSLATGSSKTAYSAKLLSFKGEKMRSIGGEGCGYQFKITLTKSGPQISIGINSSIYNDQNQLCVSYGSI